MKILLLLLILFQLNKAKKLPYYKYAIMNEEINNFTTYIYDQCSVIENKCPTSSKNQDIICNTLYRKFFPVKFPFTSIMLRTKKEEIISANLQYDENNCLIPVAINEPIQKTDYYRYPKSIVKQKMKEKIIEHFKQYGYPNDESEVSPKTQEDNKALNLFRKLLYIKLLCGMDDKCIKNELDNYFSRKISPNIKIETQKPIMRNLRITINIKNDIRAHYIEALNLFDLIDRSVKPCSVPDFGNNDDWCEFIFSIFFPSWTKYC
jgi:hypothetical protein